MATTSGRPNRSRMGFGRCEIPAPRSSMLLSVRFGNKFCDDPRKTLLGSRTLAYVLVPNVEFIVMPSRVGERARGAGLSCG